MSLRWILETRHPRLFATLVRLREALLPGLEPELVLVPHLCDAASDAFDVGANHGSYTARMLQHAARVTAFEPNPGLARVLRHRFAGEIRRGRLVVQACALSDGEGEGHLVVPRGASALASLSQGAAAGADSEVVAVARRPLAAFGERRVGFVKIDVEGHEDEVLRGGLPLLRRDLPHLLIEIEDRHRPGNLARVRDLLGEAGYRGFYLQEGRLKPLEGFDAAVLQSREALDPTGTRRLPGRVYINNFLFVARPDALERLPAALRPA